MGRNEVRRKLALLAILLSFSFSFKAQADDRDVRTLLVTGTYGIAAGTLLGLVTLPFTQDIRSVFIGSSIGLYLGIAVGIYHINNRDDAGNPLRGQYSYLEPEQILNKPIYRVSVRVFQF